MDDTTKKAALAANVAASPKWFSVQIAAAFGVISSMFYAWLASIPVDQQIAFVTTLLSKYSWGLPLIPIVGFGLRYWARVHPQTPPSTEPQSPAADAIMEGGVDVAEKAQAEAQANAQVTASPPERVLPPGERPINL